MPDFRRVAATWPSTPTFEGAGVRLNRVFGNRAPEQTDPFLLLDYFHSDNPRDFMAGFPWHPHRGMETVTYMLRGRVEHGDSLGNKGVIGPGEVQWMTAGSGIVHEEMPQDDGGIQGFQLWVNLPRENKMMHPRYQEIAAASIPVVDAGGGVQARLVAGAFGGQIGPVRDIVTGPLYMDISMPARAAFEAAIPAGHRAFVFVFEGEVTPAPSAPAASEQAFVLYGDGDAVRVTTERGPARFLIAAGTPLAEPIAWMGPIVMNTREELQQAFDEYRDGTFLRHG